MFLELPRFSCSVGPCSLGRPQVGLKAQKTASHFSVLENRASNSWDQKSCFTVFGIDESVSLHSGLNNHVSSFWDRQRVSRLSASRNHVSYHWSSEKHVTCPSGLKKQLSLPSVSEKHGEPTSAGKKHLASFRQCQAQDNVSNFDFAFVRRANFISMLRSVLSESLSRTLWAFSDFRSYG